EGASRVSTRKPLEYPDNDFTKPKEYAQWLAEVFQNRPQPLAAWSRAAYTKAYRDFQGQPLMLDREIVKLRSASASKQSRLQLLSLLNMAAQRSETLRFDSLMPLTVDLDPEVRAYAVYRLSFVVKDIPGYARNKLSEALMDKDK